jgi:hypothetical protein
MSAAAAIRIFRYWIPAILTAAMISVFSTGLFRENHTGKYSLRLLRWLLPVASAHLHHRLHTAIRKMAHVIEFGLFSITVFHGIRGGRFGWRFNWAFATLVIAITYAGLD